MLFFIVFEVRIFIRQMPTRFTTAKEDRENLPLEKNEKYPCCYYLMCDNKTLMKTAEFGFLLPCLIKLIYRSVHTLIIALQA